MDRQAAPATFFELLPAPEALLRLRARAQRTRFGGRNAQGRTTITKLARISADSDVTGYEMATFLNSNRARVLFLYPEPDHRHADGQSERVSKYSDGIEEDGSRRPRPGSPCWRRQRSSIYLWNSGAAAIVDEYHVRSRQNAVPLLRTPQVNTAGFAKAEIRGAEIKAPMGSARRAIGGRDDAEQRAPGFGAARRVSRTGRVKERRWMWGGGSVAKAPLHRNWR
jgi:hypothetical protein